jgi:hypothetical protein
MVVRLLTGLSGPDVSHAAGDLYTCDEATAARLVAAGFAEATDARTAAVTGPTEAAVRSPARGRVGRPPKGP